MTHVNVLRFTFGLHRCNYHDKSTVFEVNISKAYNVLARGVVRIFQRGGGGHTVPKRGYSPDFHVVFTTCYTFA